MAFFGLYISEMNLAVLVFLPFLNAHGSDEHQKYEKVDNFYYSSLQTYRMSISRSGCVCFCETMKQSV